MKKLFTAVILLTLVITGAYADIKMTGDARVRPRLDIVDQGSYDNRTDNIYYFYRARLNVAADIGEGYFFKTKLGYNGAANFAKFGTGTLPTGISLASAGRSPLSFMEVYFGHQSKSYGWAAGIIPVPHNPLLDMHFYPGKMANIPWLLFNNAAAPGFDFNYRLAGGKFDLKVLVDNNDGVKESSEGDVIDSLTTTDQYSLDASYSLALSGIKLTPQFLMTIADEGDPAPVTYGAALALPKVAGFGVSAYFGMTNQNADDTNAYSGWITRAKLVGMLGPGALTAWYDIATYTPDDASLEPTNTSFMWISYTYTLHKSDKGSVTLAPTYRLYTQETEGSLDYARTNIELTTQITFK
ncbi:MAG: hypothetical protein HN914_00565 [Candidatus Marinimicrobia bacterium]|nr:hypothetical protein [Candidatus Neomarinimicrobiota bacterium]